ncbi:peptidoglycan DD-metalloendopeptidase family protein [Kocuria rosea]|uniref:M23 family metallopeptidase n=1 Tax=Kocuria rosea TaxID=1275 RepID=UPI003D339E3B
MPRDSSRRPARPGLRQRASSPVTALTAFSALVAVSVAVSSGISPDTGQGRGSAFGAPAASAERTEQRDSGWSLLAAGQERTAPPAGPLRDDRTTSPVRDGGAGQGSWRAGTGRGDGGRESASTVRPGRQAPKLYQGELPVNTIIAPARPGAVLPGGQFGWRIAPDRGGREFHNGTDVSAAAGLPIVAALDGVVTAVFWDVWGGNRVEVTHADGIRTTYNHLEDVRVRTGDRLAASEQLGTVGATGVRVTGPHLHFETWVDGQAVDPQSFDWVDGMRVIPASRSKYSLEVPVPGTVEDPAAQKAEAAKKADAAKKAAAAKKADAAKKAEAAKKKTEAEKKRAEKAKAEKTKAEAEKTKADAAKKAKAEKTGNAKQPAKQVEAAPAAPVVTTPPPVALTPTPTTPGSPAAQPDRPDPVETVPAPVETVPAPVETVPDPVETVPDPVETLPDPVEPDPVEPELEPGVAPVVVPDAVRDTDGDGTIDMEDPDIDGDKIPNELDSDIDGDDIDNADDPDLDGDGLRNEDDLDRDGDGIPNDQDAEPDSPAPKAAAEPATGRTGTTDPASPAEGAGAAGAAGAEPDAEPGPAAGADGTARP